MAAKIVTPAVAGQLDDVHTTAQNRLGMEAKDDLGRTWLYLGGCTGCVQGSWVTFDELGVTTLLAANAIGPVAVAGAALIAGTYGWFCVRARNGVNARLAANCADNSRLGREVADGVCGDGRAAGDEIYGAFARTATAGAAALGMVQICDPFVDDVNGA